MEVTSNVDTEANDLTDMNTHLRIDSSEEAYNDNDDPSKPPLAIGSACSRSDFENDDTPVDSNSPPAHRMTISCVYSTSSTITTNHAMMMMIENRIGEVASEIT